MAVVALPVRQGLGERVAPCLGQQEDADDADEGAAGEDDVMEEVTLLVVKVHDGPRQRAETSAGQDEAQAATSVGGKSVILEQKNKRIPRQVLHKPQAALNVGLSTNVSPGSSKVWGFFTPIRSHFYQAAAESAAVPPGTILHVQYRFLPLEVTRGTVSG